MIRTDFIKGSPSRSEGDHQSAFAQMGYGATSFAHCVREGWCRLVDVIRTDFRQDVETLYGMVPSELKEWLEMVIQSCVPPAATISCVECILRSANLGVSDDS